MPQVSVNNEVITVIVIFSVEPERQQELVNAIAEFLIIVRQQPGFVSASIHKSLDGVKVANYAQWQSLEDYQNFIDNTEIQAKPLHVPADLQKIFLKRLSKPFQQFVLQSVQIHQAACSFFTST